MAAVARVAMDGGFAGVTVSTLNEAEHFVAAGVSDVLYSTEFLAARVPRAARLVRAGARLSVVLQAAFEGERRWTDAEADFGGAVCPCSLRKHSLDPY